MMAKPFIVGVSGLIASGKSTLCEHLQTHHGFYWIEADALVRALYKKGEPGYEKIKSYFGGTYVGATEVNRGRLRRAVLAHPQKLWILNQLIHPLIHNEVRLQLQRLKKSHGEVSKVCLEALYFEESDLGKFIDQLIIVQSTDEAIQSRLTARKLPVNQQKAFLKIQRKSLPRWGIAIENNGDLSTFFDELHRTVPQIGPCATINP